MITALLLITLFSAVWGDSPHDFNEPRRHALKVVSEQVGRIPYDLKYSVQTRDWKRAARAIANTPTGFDVEYQRQLAETMYSGEWQSNPFYNRPVMDGLNLETRL